MGQHPSGCRGPRDPRTHREGEAAAMPGDQADCVGKLDLLRRHGGPWRPTHQHVFREPHALTRPPGLPSGPHQVGRQRPALVRLPRQLRRLHRCPPAPRQNHGPRSLTHGIICVFFGLLSVDSDLFLILYTLS